MQEVMLLRDLTYMVRAGYTYRNHDSSSVAIALKSAVWWRCSKSRSNLDWVARSFFWGSDRECGIHLRVNLKRTSSRTRRSFPVEILISKWLMIFFVEVNGYLERNFDQTFLNIVRSLSALFLSSQDVSPFLTRCNHRFRVGRDTARSPRVPPSGNELSCSAFLASREIWWRRVAPVHLSIYLNVTPIELWQGMTGSDRLSGLLEIDHHQ
jgi:hypothetical protein